MADERKSNNSSDKRSLQSTPAAARIARSEELQAATELERRQSMERSRLAALLRSSDSRALAQRTAEVMELLQEDEKRGQPLIDLNHELAVSCMLRQLRVFDERRA